MRSITMADNAKKVKDEPQTKADNKISEGKLKALGLAVDQITKQFGACSPLSGCDTSKLSVSTPSRLA